MQYANRVSFNRVFVHRCCHLALGRSQFFFLADEGYARAYAGVSDCCSFLYMYFEPSDANLREADAASRKALELDP
jgi:hypothetical protein